MWEYQAEEDGEKVDMFMDANEEIRFRVISESFVDTSPNAPEATKKPPTAGQTDVSLAVSIYSLNFIWKHRFLKFSSTNEH